MNKKKILDEIFKRKIIAVIRLDDNDKLINVIKAIYKGGVSVIEITMTVPDAIKMVKKITNQLDEDIILGVGSVGDSKTAERAIQVGAQFVVSPFFKKEIIKTAHKYDTAVMSGAFTPTEIQKAYESGADVIKIFPADVVGMKFFKAVLAPMPYLKLMPTGGVNLDNAGEWIRTGACAVGVGSALLDKFAINNNKFDTLTQNAKRIVTSLTNINKIE
ncbi:4-hydroxy-2-oxoglutarate aldolase [hydrocarbon metagenome]|uniref:4-hydroxy-2-oxoglutarate aldolase n=1 Tax=hydrocarbon metagenome TaxID=938273 RepID=A0A0W8FY32_9ZZZZ